MVQRVEQEDAMMMLGTLKLIMAIVQAIISIEWLDFIECMGLYYASEIMLRLV